MRVNIESAAVARESQLTHNISYTSIPSHGTNENSNNVNVSSRTKSDDNSCHVSLETTTIVNTHAQNQGTDSEVETTEGVAITEGTTDAQVVLPPDGTGTVSNTVATPDIANGVILDELD